MWVRKATQQASSKARMPISWCFRFSKEALPWGIIWLQLGYQTTSLVDNGFSKCQCPSSQCYTKEGSSFAHSECWVHALILPSVAFFTCISATAALGPQAHLLEGGMGLYQGYFKFTHMYVASKLFLIYINIYIKSQLSIFILFAFYIHGNNVYQLFFSDIFYF